MTLGNCDACNGCGKIMKLLVSGRAIAAIARVAPNEKVAISDPIDCPKCFGTGTLKPWANPLVGGKG